MGIKLTLHSIERARERFNLRPSELKRLAEESLDQGSDVFSDEFLRPIFLRKIKNYENTSGIYYHQGIFFIFVDDFLATVYPISFLSEYQK